MKKILYIGLFLILCLLPFAGMALCPTMETVENREMASLPRIRNKGKWNPAYAQGLSDYFEDHFAFRHWMVSLDSLIQCGIFRTSPNKAIVCGDHGWLYYANTVNDYLGQKQMTGRELNNVAHNLSLAQYFAEESGADFLFTIAPNKNSLYGDKMPYYNSIKASKGKNVDRLLPYLEDYEVNYQDLYAPFRSRDEILYLKRDSHWTNKGAAIAYHEILKALDISHKDYTTTEEEVVNHNYIGDLSKMVYPRMAVPEDNPGYSLQQNWHFTQGQSVEDGYSRTACREGHGSLLMYRDSFGYTLLPLMAGTFKEATFINEYPYLLEEEMEESQPETVIVERVERELREYLTDPPVISAIEVEAADSGDSSRPVHGDLNISQDDTAPDYWNISGTVDKPYIKEDTTIYVTVDDGEDIRTYETYGIGERAFRMYLYGNELPESRVSFTVYADDLPVIVKTIDIGKINWE